MTSTLHKLMAEAHVEDLRRQVARPRPADDDHHPLRVSRVAGVAKRAVAGAVAALRPQPHRQQTRTRLEPCQATASPGGEESNQWPNATQTNRKERAA